MEKVTIQISDKEDDTRIDRLIRRYYPALSQGMIEKFLRKNLIKLDDKKISSNTRVKTNQILSIATIIIPKDFTKKPKKIISQNVIKDFKRSIIFYNHDIIAINKLSGLATQGGSNIQYSVDDLIKNIEEFDELDPKLVHRIDKDTSGVLIIASNVHSANVITKDFRQKTIEKKYLALVFGRPKQNQGIINIALQAENNSKKTISKNQAITKYRIIDCLSDKISLIEFIPVTGRTHQIRIHAKLMNMPIIGDQKYGYFDHDLMVNQSHLHLHSWQINIDNLFDKKYQFTAPIPKYMKDNIDQLGLKLK